MPKLPAPPGRRDCEAWPTAFSTASFSRKAAPSINFLTLHFSLRKKKKGEKANQEAPASHGHAVGPRWVSVAPGGVGGTQEGKLASPSGHLGVDQARFGVVSLSICNKDAALPGRLAQSALSFGKVMYTL